MLLCCVDVCGVVFVVWRVSCCGCFVWCVLCVGVCGRGLCFVCVGCGVCGCDRVLLCECAILCLLCERVVLLFVCVVLV